MNRDTRLALKSGNMMPTIALGTWELTSDTAATVATALKLGYRMIDTSGDYGTQPATGAAIARSGWDRSDLFIVTKVEEDEDIFAATCKNLQELQLDYADLVLIHRPPLRGDGRELWRGLMQAKADGLVRDIGVSNYSTALIDSLLQETDDVPAVNQIEWSPFGFSPAMLRYARERDIVIQAYSPLTRSERLDETALTKIADANGKSTAQILLRWNLQHGTVPLPKANRLSHVQENLNIFDFALSDAHMAALDQLNERYSSLGTLPYE
jgi:2,5-diketo-D-gluconate reductase A